jgi:hypothetical protein
MNTLGRILLLVGGLVLALLVGVLIGRGQRVEPTSEGNAQAVQITTAPPPAMPAVTPLPAPVPQPPPQPVAVPKVTTPDMQVQEDAAAVGMTTRESGDTGAPANTPPPRSAAGGGADPARAQPNG